MKTKTQWTHKVVKKSRGGDGEWFSHPTAKTGSLEECIEYAELFLEDQLQPTALGNSLRGDGGHRIIVVSRSGNVEKTFRY